MNALEVLKESRKIIEKPEHWTQGALARDEQGFATELYDANAACFCAIGAIEKINCGSAGYNAHIALTNTVGDEANFAEYNDTHSHAEVLAVWDETIKRLEAAL